MRTLNEVVFDLDGTLIDTMPAYADIFVEVCSGTIDATPETTREYYLEHSGKFLADQFDGYLRSIGHPITEDLVAQMDLKFKELAYDTPIRLFEGAAAVLGFFGSQSPRPRLLISTSSSNARHKLECCKIAHRFDRVLGGAHGRKGSEHFNAFAVDARRSITAWAKDACSIGDSPHDMELAHEFGVFAIGVAHTVSRDKLLKAGAQLVVDRIAQLPEALLAL